MYIWIYCTIAFELWMLCTEALRTMLYMMRKYNMYVQDVLYYIAVEYNALCDFKHNTLQLEFTAAVDYNALCDYKVQYVCLGCTLLQLLSTMLCDSKHKMLRMYCTATVEYYALCDDKVQYMFRIYCTAAVE